MTKSFLFECREAARVCYDGLIAKLLRDATDELSLALARLSAHSTTENMQSVVALWTKAEMIRRKAMPTPDPAPVTGTGEQERMAA